MSLVPQRFTNAANTNVRRTFDRIRWQMRRDGVKETRTFVGTLVVGRVSVAPKTLLRRA